MHCKSKSATVAHRLMWPHFANKVLLELGLREGEEDKVDATFIGNADIPLKLFFFF